MRDFDMNNFDKILENSFSEAPPEDILNSVIPWNKPLLYISIGFVISLIHIGSSNLKYFTSVFGLILIMLGFRMLRAENKYFLTCWLLSIFRILLLYPSYIANATIYSSEFANNMPVQLIIGGLSIFSTITLQVCFYKGLCCVVQKTNSIAYLQDIKNLVGWFLSAFVMFGIFFSYFSSFGIFFSAIIMLISSSGIFMNLYRVLCNLRNAGYLVQTAKIRLPDWAVILSICGSLLFGIGCGYLFVDDLEETLYERDNEEYQDLYRVKESLHEKGLDKNLLNSFSIDDLTMLGTAEDIVYWTDDSNFRINLFHIAARLPGETETWKIFHCIREIDLALGNCIDAIELRTPNQISPAHWQLSGDISGNIGGNSYSCIEYSKLETITYKKNGWFDDPREVTSTFISFNNNSVHFGAYISYQVTALTEDATLQSELTYIHQTTWMQYPVKTPVEAYTENSGRPTEVFQTLTKIFELDTSEY